MAPEPLALAALFFAVAMVYATVGFGGGSAYLALLTLVAVPLPQVAPVALICNIIVVTGGSWQFIRAGHFNARLILPFLVTSLPAAYIGGSYRLDVELLEVVTAVALMAAAVAMLLRDAWLREDVTREIPSKRLWVLGPMLGGVLGGLAGLIGIGGGIFLAPVLHLLRWGTAKQVATVASLFILANSLAGLAGKASQLEGATFLVAYVPLFVAVLAGGQIGSRLGAWRVQPRLVRRITAAVVLVAAVHLLIRG